MTATELKAEGFSSDAPIKSEYSDEAATAEEGGLADPNHVELHRALKARHITMIGMSDLDFSTQYTDLTFPAIGGAIGTGLIIGTGEALAK